jgi:hypothetical protein
LYASCTGTRTDTLLRLFEPSALALPLPLALPTAAAADGWARVAECARVDPADIILATALALGDCSCHCSTPPLEPGLTARAGWAAAVPSAAPTE